MLFLANFHPIPTARKTFMFIRCIEFFGVVFFLKQLGFLPKNSILKRNCRENDFARIPKEKLSVHSGQKNICTCPVLLIFAIAFPFKKSFIFIENTEISRVRFMQKLQRKTRSLRDFEGKNVQNSAKVLSTFVQDG